MKEKFWQHFNTFALLFLFILLIIVHMGMMGLNRPPEMVHWVETLISSVFAAMLAILATKKPGD